jgi:hypothetical protein
MNTHHFNYWKLSTFVCIVIILFLTQCGAEKEIIEVPVRVEIPKIIKQTDTIYKPVPVRIEVPEPGMDELLDKYASTMDSLERLKMFVDAITVREYNNTFEDDTIKIDTWSKVRGELLAQSNLYEIKPRSITVPVEIEIPRFNALFLYGGTRYSLIDKTPAFEAKIIFKNKRDNLLSIGVDTQGFFSAGLGFKLN